MSDHVRGQGSVELTVFADFECPYCRDAQPSLARVEARMQGRITLRFRHFPMPARHPRAERAAEAAEAAGVQGRFWEMHDRLFAAQRELEDADLRRHAEELGLDMARFDDDVASGRLADAITEDRELGASLGVASTPSFLVAGERHHGFYDVESLVDALEDAGA